MDVVVNGIRLVRMMMKGKRYILASGSPRRRELMAMLDLDFTVDTSRTVDEVVPPGTRADMVPVVLAELKASAYRQHLLPDDVLITADTVVVLDDAVIGKPADEEEARAILRRLSGRTHKVVTAVTISTVKSQTTFREVTEVEFAELSDKDIDYYVMHYHPLDKAGAYGIQEWIGAVGVKRINGCFYNVMGLPVQALYARLSEIG